MVLSLFLCEMLGYAARQDKPQALVQNRPSGISRTFSVKESPMSFPTNSLVSNRRVFMLQAVTATGVLVLAREASAQAMLSETDPQAAALGYKADASKVDKAKNPKFATGQACANCALFQGSGAAGACGIFPGKQVSAKGWCTAYAKKA